MAIQNFKNIEERKGYLVEDADRKIFEKEIGKSSFGLGYADMIEFIIYDSSDNQLPQGDDGKLVRYIDVNDDASKKYFLVSRSEFTKKSNDAPELIVDIEQLIRDAGYNVGIFKTQITLLNRRVGKEDVGDDKLWIHEISPSRTEIRLLPIKNTQSPSEDLLRRYEIFTNEGNFRDDTIYYVRDYINNINIQQIFQNFLYSKGAIEKGKKYSDLIKKEFKIDSVEIFFTRVNNKFNQAMNYFIDGRVYQITDNNYGKPRQGIDIVELSIAQIKRIIHNSLFEIIDYYLPKRDIQDENILTPEQQITFDKVKNILKSSTSNEIYESDIPDETRAQIRGCTDSDAENYNPLAQVDDGSCTYPQIEIEEPEVIKGCTDSTAENYNKFATDDDGSCRYEVIEETEEPTPTSKTTKTWYVWSSTADIKYKVEGVINNRTNLKEYESFTITYDDNTLKWIGDIREIPKQKVQEIETRSYYIENITNKTNNFSGLYVDAFNANGYDSYSNDFVDRGQPLTATYVDKLGVRKVSSYIEPGESITLCAKKDSIPSVNGLRIIEAGVCGTTYRPPIDTTPTPNSGGGGSGGGGGFGNFGGENEFGNPVVGGGTSNGRRNDGSFVDERSDRRDRNML